MVVRVVHPDFVESMIRGLPVMMGWCNVVSLEVHCEIESVSHCDCHLNSTVFPKSS